MIYLAAAASLAVMALTPHYLSAIQTHQIETAIADVYFGRDGGLWLLTRGGGVLWTSDGGITWKEASVSADAERITFADDQHGWVFTRRGNVLKTTDGGVSWQLLSNLWPGGPPIVGTTTTSAEFVDSAHGWALGSYRVWRTKDGGATWEQVKLGEPNLSFSLLHFADQKAGLICVDGGNTYGTRDGGDSWHERGLVGNGATPTAISFVGTDTGWLIASTRIYRTTDGGQTWTKQATLKPDLTAYSIHFANERDGWATAADFKPDQPTSSRFKSLLLHTGDGGDTWRILDAPNGAELCKRVFFWNPTSGWLYTDTLLYRTEDGGNSWNPVVKYPRPNYRID
jgi:photosystem II stability/assembly factor-like uncharacterized protein